MIGVHSNNVRNAMFKPFAGQNVDVDITFSIIVGHFGKYSMHIHFLAVTRNIY